MLDFSEWREIKFSDVKTGDIVIVTLDDGTDKLIKVLGIGLDSFVGISGFFSTGETPLFEHGNPVVVSSIGVEIIFRKPL